MHQKNASEKNKTRCTLSIYHIDESVHIGCIEKIATVVATAGGIWTRNVSHAERTLTHYTMTLYDGRVALADLTVDSRLRLPNLYAYIQTVGWPASCTCSPCTAPVVCISQARPGSAGRQFCSDESMKLFESLVLQTLTLRKNYPCDLNNFSTVL